MVGLNQDSEHETEARSSRLDLELDLPGLLHPDDVRGNDLTL